MVSAAGFPSVLFSCGARTFSPTTSQRSNHRPVLLRKGGDVGHGVVDGRAVIRDEEDRPQ